MIQTKHQSWIALILAFLIFSSSFAAQAQNQFQLGPDPIIFESRNSLWSVDVSSQRTVELIANISGQPILSPDGNRIAYTALSPVFTDWLATTNGAGGFDYPEDLMILDLISGELFAIAEQAPDASFNGPNPNDSGQYILRSQATWSPDSQKLAWLELPIIKFRSGQNAPLGVLKVYDFATAETSIFETFSFIDKISPLDRFNLTWGRAGLAFLFRHFDPVLSDLHVYDASGTLIASTRVEEALYFSIWIQSEDKDYLFDDGDLINWQTGQSEPMVGQVEMLSLTIEDSASFYNEGRNLYLSLPEQTPIDLGTETVAYGISRDGLCGLYGIHEIDPNTGYYGYRLMVQCADNLIEIGMYVGHPDAVWGPVVWQIKSE